MSAPYPLRFEPVLKSYTWGGRALAERLGRRLPAGPIAESWEISAHPHGPTPVRDGELTGATLPEVAAAWGRRLLGRRGRGSGGEFPLLVKLLDCHRWLSVQVHPGDDWARRHVGGLGKTEMWVVLAAEPGAEILCGLRAGVDREALERAVAGERIDDALHRVPASAGDVFFVPAGTVHALGPGLLVAEIQESSDTTFRLYDWGRRPDGGRPRPLHLAEALEVTDYERVEPGPVAPRRTRDGAIEREELVRSAQFDVDRLRLPTGASWSAAGDGESCEILGLLEGDARLDWSGGPAIGLAAVEWVLVPSALDGVRLTATGPATALHVRLGKERR